MAATPSLASGAHVVVVPLPAQGHINPMMPVAHFLVSSGITVTFVHTTRSHSLITSANTDANPWAGSCSKKLRMEVIRDGLPSDYKQRLDLDMFRNTAIPLMRAGVEELLHKLMNQPEAGLQPPCCLIMDSFLPWGRDVALKFGLSRVLLWTCSATIMAMGLHVPELIAKGYIPPTQQGSLDKVVDFIPGVPPFRISELPESLRASDSLQSCSFELFRSVFEVSIKDADCILANTMYELESTVMDALTMESGLCIQPVGPLCMFSITSSSAMPPGSTRSASLLREDSSCLPWLDQQPASSVLFISFGSVVSVNDDVFTELAHGLEASGERFLWVIRPDAIAGKGSMEELLPEGFMKRTCERGLVISWAPQMAVLGHVSVGAFLTHCGWNSVLESLSKGVPMLGFPHMADQPPNLKCIVHDWKVGLPLLPMYSTSEHARKVERSLVEEAVRKMMRGEEGMQVRRRALEWKHTIAHEANANAQSYLQKLVDDLQNGRLKCPKPAENGHLRCLSA